MVSTKCFDEVLNVLYRGYLFFRNRLVKSAEWIILEFLAHRTHSRSLSCGTQLESTQSILYLIQVSSRSTNLPVNPNHALNGNLAWHLYSFSLSFFFRKLEELEAEARSIGATVPPPPNADVLAKLMHVDGSNGR